MAKILNILDKILSGLMGGMFVIILALTVAQVIFRYVLNDALSWSAELTKITFVWMTFIGSAVAINRSRHMQIDIFVNNMPPRFRNILNILIYSGMIVFLSVMTFYGVEVAEKAGRTITGALGWPRSVFILPVIISGALMIIYSLKIILIEMFNLLHNREEQS